jgi:hypothetical protein
VFRRERALFPRGAELVVIAKAGTSIDGFDAVRAEIAQAAPALSAALSRKNSERSRPARPR